MEMILPSSASAQKTRISTGRNQFTFFIVGLVTTETVTFEIPRVESPDVTTDAHWTTLYQDGVPVRLTATNNALVVPAQMVIRLNKTAGVSSNSYGVAFAA